MENEEMGKNQDSFLERHFTKKDLDSHLRNGQIFLILLYFLIPTIGYIGWQEPAPIPVSFVSNFNSWQIVLGVSAILLLISHNKLLNSIAHIISLFIAINFIDQALWTLSQLHRDEALETLDEFNQSEYIPNANMGYWAWIIFTFYVIVVITLFAIVIARLKPSGSNFLTRQQIASAIIVTFSIMTYFWGNLEYIFSNNVEQRSKFLFQVSMHQALVPMIFAIALLIVAFCNKYIYWPVAAIFMVYSSIYQISLFKLNEFGTLSHVAPNQIILAMQLIVLLISLEELYYFSAGKRAVDFKKLLEKARL